MSSSTSPMRRRFALASLTLALWPVVQTGLPAASEDRSFLEECAFRAAQPAPDFSDWVGGIGAESNEERIVLRLMTVKRDSSAVERVLGLARHQGMRPERRRYFLRLAGEEHVPMLESLALQGEVRDAKLRPKAPAEASPSKLDRKEAEDLLRSVHLRSRTGGFLIGPVEPDGR